MSITITIIALIIFPFCQTYSPREREILDLSKETSSMYEQYLVEINQYTTKGKFYHEKYRNHLLGIARMATEKFKMQVMANSIGFYHDKKSKDSSKLYLGVDFIVSAKEGYPYGVMVGHLLQKHLSDFLFIIQSCQSIFEEPEIAGSVIGMRWDNGGKFNMFNFWIEKKDADLFEKNRITLAELIERNTITNAAGQIIRLRK
ncbi:MAG: hypothetical protein N2316_05470 [Spirochaetes bacterium]|nr:hypothetical protein [Spirochaetota bacterium]